MIIDWSKAPDGATHFSPPFAGAGPLWAKQDGDRWQYRPLDLSRDWYFGVEPRADEKYIERPHAWNGEGLPPVGAVCEHRTGPGMNWSVATVLAFGEKKVFYRDSQGFEWTRPFDEIEFRHIRTPEQIAAEERKSEIEAMAKVLGVVACDDYVAAAALYDAGYRKTTE